MSKITTPAGPKKPRYRLCADENDVPLWEAQIEVYDLTLSGRGPTKAEALAALEMRVLDATVSNEIQEARDNPTLGGVISSVSAGMVSVVTTSALRGPSRFANYNYGGSIAISGRSNHLSIGDGDDDE